MKMKIKRVRRIFSSLIVVVFIATFLSYLLNSALAGLTQTSVSATSEADFEKGTLTDAVITNNSDGEVQLGRTTGDAWWNSSWERRKAVTVTNSGASQTNYQVRLPITYATGMQADFDDLRFTNSSGTALDFWLQSKIDSTSAVVWVEVSTLSAGSNTIYMYYKNDSATSASNGENTFMLFDDFSDGVIDSAKWTEVDPDSKINETGGKLVFDSTSALGWDNTVYAKTAFSRSDVAFEADYKWSRNTSSSDNLMMGWHDNGSGKSYKDLVYALYNSGSGSGATSPIYFYEDGSSRGNSGTWVYNTDYNVRMRMRLSGGNYYDRSTDGGSSWTTHYTSSYSTESNLRPGWAFYRGGHTFDNARVRKWMNTEPSASFGAVENVVPDSGEYASPTSTAANSGIIDLNWNGGWSNNGSGNAFEANVTIPANTSMQFEMRSSSVGGSDDADWSSWADLGTATSSGTYGVDAASLAGVPTGANKYVQVRATLASTDGTNNPVLLDYSLFYLADLDDPANPSATTGYSDSSKATSLADNTWYNYSSPYFEFTGATDGDSGVAGYYVYFGDDPTAIPQTAGAYQTSANYTASLSSADSGSDLYFRVQSVDNAGNVYTADPATYTLFTYKYDETEPAEPGYLSANPAGYASTDDFTFSWPAGSDDESGVSGYEYKRATDGSWTSTGSLSVSGITSYQNGENFFYVRAVDNAGNKSSTYVQTPYYYNSDAPSAPTYVQANPGSNTVNSFAFLWDLPATYTGSIVGYYYSVNNYPTLENSTYTTADSVTAFSAATKQGTNTFYVVAKDNSGNIGWANAGSVTFWSTTTAPGIPTNIFITDVSNRDISDWRLVTGWSEPSFTGDDFAGYKVYRSTNGTSFTQIATTTTTGYLDAELSNSTTYYYKVKAYDTAGNESGFSSTISEIPTGRYTSPPDLVSGPSVEATSTKATITFTTDREADSFVQFGKTTGYGSTQGQVDSTKAHTVNLSNLVPSTTYYFRGMWRDSDGNIGYSPGSRFRTDEANAISDVEVSDITLNSAVISWKTENPSTSQVEYGKTTGYGQTATDSSNSMTTNHMIKIQDLDHSSSYHFRVLGQDSEDNVTAGEDNTFATIEFPKISKLRLQPIKNRLTATVNISYETNVKTSTTVNYGEKGAVNKEAGNSTLSKKHTITISGLDDNTNYLLIAKGRDKYGSEAVSDTQKFKTGLDTRPPIVSKIKTEISLVGGNAEAVISWVTDEPATSQVEYGLGVSAPYASASNENTRLTTSHFMVIPNLNPSSIYNFRVVSKDRSKNITKSEGNPIITPELKVSVYDLIIDALKKRLDWLYKLGAGSGE